jgi:CheY-like chemotaxis protein
MSNKARVVVVEDDPDVRFLCQAKLEKEGFVTKTATDGVEGLSIIEEFHPQIILVDLLMPNMGGAEMLSRLRSTKWGSDIRVIVLTNVSKDEAPQMLRLLRVDRYVVKAHHTPAQIVQIVNEVLGNRTS